MMYVRHANERGHAQHGWLDSYHTFSFADYYDPQFMGFGPLRVINEDRVAPGQGFGEHGHQNMDIISYVLEGELEHRDTLGNGTRIVPGEVQRMRAGTGIAHSEYNASQTEPVHFLQIWIIPDTQNLEPGYAQQDFSEQINHNPMTLVASSGGKDGSLEIHQDVNLYVLKFNGADKAMLTVDPSRKIWVQVARGELTLNGETLKEGDGAALAQEQALNFASSGPAEALVFDMAG